MLQSLNRFNYTANHQAIGTPIIDTMNGGETTTVERKMQSNDDIDDNKAKGTPQNKNKNETAV